MEIEIPHNFTPRPYQERPMRFFDCGGKRAISVWHRRAGKDLTALHQTCKAAHKRRAAYWHFYPTFEQGRKAIWEGFTRVGDRILECVFPGFLDPKRPGSIVARRNEQQMIVELKCGSLWRLMGTDKIESVGSGPAGVTFSEFSLSRPTSWDFVRPMLRENGGWAWFIFTPRGRNHAHRLLLDNSGRPGWNIDIQTVHDTGLTYSSEHDPERRLTADEMMQEERASGMEEALIRQEYLCDFSAALIGSVWGDLLERLEGVGGVTAFDHPADGVFTSWDLGVSDATAIWFWRVGERGVPDVIDHYEASGKPLSHYLDEVDRRGYRYVKHYLPHDARARTLQTGVSTIELVTGRWGVDRVAITPELSLADGIQAARWLFQQPIRIHPRCGDGLEALRQYHYAWDEDRKVLRRAPEHDWSSHSADAFRYLACVARATEILMRKPEPRKPTLPVSKPWTLDDFAEPERRRF